MELAIVLLPLVTGSYALYEIRHSPKSFKLSIAVLTSAIMVEFCVFGLAPVLYSLGMIAPFTDVVWLLGITAVVAVVHLVLTVCLMIRAEPDIHDL